MWYKYKDIVILSDNKKKAKNNRMKGYFFSQLPKDNYGPQKKVRDQIKAFQDAGIDMELVEDPFDDYSFFRRNFYLRQIVNRLPFTYAYAKHTYDPRFDDADVIYIRFCAADWQFANFIRKIRRHNPDVKIIIEFPDFPPTSFMTVNLGYRIIYTPLLLKNLFARPAMRRYVDRCAVLNGMDSIYGIPTLSLMNGIDVGRISVKKETGTDVIRMIAVAGMIKAHAYDRLIKGMEEYRKKGGTRKIELHLVGGKMNETTELPTYAELIKKYNLEQMIYIHGELTGDDLDNVYDSCNVAVGALGIHRMGYKNSSGLKIREYLSKGFPLIVCDKEDIFRTFQFDYKCVFPDDESSINVKKIIDAFDQWYIDGEKNVIDYIRSFARKYCDYSYTMKQVFDYCRRN